MRQLTKCTLYYIYITQTLLVKQYFKNSGEIYRTVLGSCRGLILPHSQERIGTALLPDAYQRLAGRNG